LTLRVGRRAVIGDAAKERLAKRQAAAAVALLRLHEPEKVWPLFKHSSDPQVRSYLVNALAPRGASPAALIKQFEESQEITSRRALLLSLGGFGKEMLPAEEEQQFSAKLQELYRTADDAGLHAAAEGLLRQWNAKDWLRQSNEQWAKDKAFREQRLESIRKAIAAGLVPSFADTTRAIWYVNSQGQTLIVVPGPVEFTMGSPAADADRVGNEQQHRRRIGRSFGSWRQGRDGGGVQAVPSAVCP
jgi:hypothetical protein